MCQEQSKKCDICGKENRNLASFCRRCGARLATNTTQNSAELDSIMPEIIGHKALKELTKTIISTHLNHIARGIKRSRNNDLLIFGSSGTGKSLIVKSLAKVLYENGILTKEEPIVLNAVTSLQSYLNEADKHLDEISGALLCVDAFQGLAHNAKDGSAITELERLYEVKAMVEGKGNYMMIVVTGIDNGDISAYLHNNSNIAANFRQRIDLEDYSVDELVNLTVYFLSQTYSMMVEAAAVEKLRRIYKQMVIDKDKHLEQNGKYVLKIVDKIFDKSQARDAMTTIIKSEDIEGKEYVKKTYKEAISELDKYVGIDEIRKEIKSIGDSIEVAAEDGEGFTLKNHYLFLGNPGTGKTTIARVLSNVLTALEALPLGHIVEVDRSQMVSSYVGETAKNVTKIVQKALGGILFIDEAYTLVKDNNDSFGKEAVDTLLKLMEDNRGKFVVIAAGYTNEMRRFVDSNPGLKSRFNKTINFRDYEPEELTQIFNNMCSASSHPYMVETAYEPHLLSFFKSIYNQKGKDFANARTVRNVFESAIERHNTRIEELRSQGFDITNLRRVFTKEDIEGDRSSELTIDEAMAHLDELIGMAEVKEAVKKLRISLEIERERIERGLFDPKNSSQHIVITGNPGTGKTTVAKLLGSIFHAIGLLPSDKVIEKEAKDLKSSYVNETAKLMNDAVDEAMGGILFIDEAYMLMNIDANGKGDQTGKEAIGALITRMLNDAGKFVLVMAGYPKEMNAFVDKANPGFRRRFRAFLNINDYTAEELYQIFMLKAKKQNLILTDDAERWLKIKIEQMVNTKSETFGNAGEIDKLLNSVVERQSIRLHEMKSSGQGIDNQSFLTIEAEDIPVERPEKVDPTSILANLDGFVGLHGVKTELRNMVNTINLKKKIADLEGRPIDKALDHYVFMGNPGTGKTTIARMMANVLFSMGLLSTNTLVEVKREDLVAGYAGQTAPKVKQVVQSALGGVLFIDEAYTLVQGPNDSFGMEALNTLLTLLLTYKEKFVCIVAGYSSNMNDFLYSNPGLSSRFTKTITFEDYTPEELTEIFINKVKRSPYKLTDDARSAVFDYFTSIYNNRDMHFGNARTVGNFFEDVQTAHSNRVAEFNLDDPDLDKNLLTELRVKDIINAQ